MQFVFKMALYGFVSVIFDVSLALCQLIILDRLVISVSKLGHILIDEWVCAASVNKSASATSGRLNSEPFMEYT